MKTTQIYQLLFALFIFNTTIAAQNVVTESIVISGTRFTYPLIEKWIAEYKKANPTSIIKLVSKSETIGTTDLSIIAHQPVKDELKADQDIVYAGRFGLLPVTNRNNPILSSAKRGLTKKDIDKLFFEVVNIDEDPVIEKPKYRAIIYSRDNKADASKALANYFGHESSEIRGKKVLGDDIYLISAIKKDTIGLTYNNLGYLYDTNSRILKDGVALLPLELKKETKSIHTGDLDEVISVLEKNKVETIPVEKFGFIYSRQNVRKEVSDFLKWVLTDGQKFNHEKGFLNLDKELLAEQTKQLNEKLLTLK